jgi:hypothetical protein
MSHSWVTKALAKTNALAYFEPQLMTKEFFYKIGTRSEINVKKI